MNTSSIVLALQKWATLQPGKIALRYLLTGDVDGPKEEITYAMLSGRVSSVSKHLGDCCRPGDRALLLYPPGPAFVSGFLGCLQAAVTAVPAFPPNPSNLERGLSRLLTIVHDAKPSVILTSSDVIGLVESIIDRQSDLDTIPVIATDELPERPNGVQSEVVRGNELAFLQYTSGSTGPPKGVMVTHANLDHNERTIHRVGRHSENPSIVSWLPVYHDMGLIGGVLQPIFAGGTGTLMSAFAFLAKPARWLAAINHYRGISSPFPNFALDLCVRKVDPESIPGLDLSCWQVAWNGAEPVRSDSLRRFTDRFGPFGFDPAAHFPVYGLAEGTLIASAPELGSGYRTMRIGREALESGQVEPVPSNVSGVDLTGCGRPIRDSDIRIVDADTSRDLTGSCKIGEIWLNSPSVAAGYWQKPEETKVSFDARLPSGEGPYLRTGDLGFIHEGQLFITGRLKDLIIIRGRNVPPDGLERSAELAHRAVRPGCSAAFALEREGREVAALVAEVDPRKLGDVDIEQLAGLVLEHVAGDHELALHILVLIEPRTIPKTSSGKIRRRATRRALEDGALVEMHRWEKASGSSLAEPEVLAPCDHDVEAWLLEWLAAEAGLDAFSLDPNESFASHGLDSAKAVELAAALSDRLGTEIPPTVAWDHPSPRRLARYLSGTRVSGVQPRTATAAEEPIAIIAGACRFPGGVEDFKSLWRLLDAGTDAITEVPASRWDIDRFFDPDVDAPGKTYTRWGGFVGDVDSFDAAFFGISGREAASIDPQQRLLLETAWETIERAGLNPGDLEGSQTGVYMGIAGTEYQAHAMANATRIDAYSLLGTAHSSSVGRLSYRLGLLGPNFPVDTACSSSLVALHLACQGLRNGDCDMALSGGVNLLLSPEGYIYFSRLKVASPTGRCHTFSADADGYVRGEGCGMVLLKRLSDAQRDGDRILALVRGTAVNQDGRSNGFTAPNGPAQQAVIRRALEQAGIEPHTVDAVECHGTGTPLGDPIEVQALAAVYGEARPQDRPVAIGSIKTNIGHTEGAAGIAAVLKAVLALQHQTIPKTLHFSSPNRNIAWSDLNVRVAAEGMPWPETDHPRRMGVSSFGFSGTNAHAILEEAPEPSADHAAASTEDAAKRCRTQPVVLSGHTPEALAANAARLVEYLGDKEAAPTLTDLVSSLINTRAAFRIRLALPVTAQDADAGYPTLRQALQTFAESGLLPRDGHITPTGHRPGKIAVLFTGQGSQRLNMGRDVHGQPGFEAFTSTFDAAVAACEAHLDRSLAEVVWSDDHETTAGDETLLNRTRYTQPALFAVETALFRQCQAWGLKPDMLLGHSVGELVAAHVAGVFSLEDAATLVCARGRLMDELATSRGAMACLQATEEEVRSTNRNLPADLQKRVDIAGLNTPTQTVVSGDTEAVAAQEAAFESMGRKVTRLSVSHAFHSIHMDTMLHAFREVAEELSYNPQTSFSIISNVSGKPANTDNGDLVTADYWVRHVRQAVRFVDGMNSALEGGATTFLECGPRGVLCGMAAECVAAKDENEEDQERSTAFLPTLRTDRDETLTMMSALCGLHVCGHALDWQAFFAGTEAKVADLPTYAFQRERYWLEANSQLTDPRDLGLTQIEHPLLGAAVPLANGDGVVFAGRISVSKTPWLADHVVFDTVIMPGTGLMELTLAAARAVGCSTVSELTLVAPMAFPDESAVRVQLHIGALDTEGRRHLAISSRSEEASEDAAWTRHATGVLSSDERFETDRVDALLDWPPRGATPVDVTELYPTLANQGLNFGPAFHGLTEAWTVGEQIYGRVVPPKSTADTAGDYGIHPAVLDAALHVLFMPILEAGIDPDQLFLPFGWSDVTLYATGATELRVQVSVSSLATSSGGELTASVVVADPIGQPIATIGALQLRGATAEQIRAAVRADSRDLYQIDWVPVMPPDAVSQPSGLVLGGDGRLAAALGLEWLADTRELLAMLDAGGAVPEQLIMDATTPLTDAVDVPTAVNCATEQALTDLQTILTAPRLSSAETVWVTSSAVCSANSDAAPDLVHAPLWGLVRSARSENPGRQLRLVDLDDEIPAAKQLWAALAADGEPELALRQVSPQAPRLIPARATFERSTPDRPLQPDGTVLITGGLGELGQALAKHLVREHGALHLTLTSRRGMKAPGAQELVTSLETLGAKTVIIAACDVADRGELSSVISAIPDAQSLTAVFHLAGVLDDGVVTELTPERFTHVLRPKVKGAWNLHELTEDHELVSFVLFSSAAGVMGGPGQSNYAAANSFLDVLAAYRRTRGLPGTSLAWGLWEQRGTGMTAHLGPSELARMARWGIAPMPLETGLQLLDAALCRPEAGLVPMRLDAARLQQRVGDAASAPALFRALLRPGLRRVGAEVANAAALRRRLAALPEAERFGALLELVRTEVAAVLGISSQNDVPSDKPLSDLGLDSLMAVELRNQLTVRAETTLPTTLALDTLTLDALAGQLLERLGGTITSAAPTLEPAQLSPNPIADMRVTEPSTIEKRMRALHERWPQADILARAFRLHGPVDVPALDEATSIVLKRHFAVPRPGALEKLAVLDASSWTDQARDTWLMEQAARPFDLEEGPLLRLHLLTNSSTDFLFQIVLHHLLCDADSVRRLLYTISATYQFLTSGACPALELDDASITLARAEALHQQTPSGPAGRAFWRDLIAQENVPIVTPKPNLPEQTSLTCREIWLEQVLHAPDRNGTSVGISAARFIAAFQHVLQRSQRAPVFLCQSYMLRQLSGLERASGPAFGYGLVPSGPSGELFGDRLARTAKHQTLARNHLLCLDSVGPHGSVGQDLPIEQSALITVHIGTADHQSETVPWAADVTATSHRLPVRQIPYGWFLSIAKTRDRCFGRLSFNEGIMTEEQANDLLENWRNLVFNTPAN